jgi:hypothetical protein
VVGSPDTSHSAPLAAPTHLPLSPTWLSRVGFFVFDPLHRSQIIR